MISDIERLIEKYRERFGEGPPIFGYLHEDIIQELKISLKTGKPMVGAEEYFWAFLWHRGRTNEADRFSVPPDQNAEQAHRPDQ